MSEKQLQKSRQPVRIIKFDVQVDQSRSLKVGSPVYQKETELQRLNRIGRASKPKVLWNDIVNQSKIQQQSTFRHNKSNFSNGMRLSVKHIQIDLTEK